MMIIPTAPYFLRYHHRLYRGPDYLAAEYASDISYDSPLYPSSIEALQEECAPFTVIYASNYARLQDAIDDAHLKGGVIVVADKSVTTDRLRLKSNICLCIPADVTLTVTGYKTEKNTFRFIEAENAENIRITGGGKIHGPGAAYWNRPDLVPIVKPVRKYNIKVLEYIHFGQKYTRKEELSVRFLVFESCTGIQVDNILVEDSPGWNLSFEGCRDVRVNRAVFNSNYHGANTDGIDVCGTSNVLINDCYIAVGDDAICLKNDKLYNGREVTDMRNMRVSNCRIRTATNGFKIGTGVYHNISNVQVSGLTMDSGELYPPMICGITITVSDGGTVSDVTIEDITINKTLAPVFIRVSNRNNNGDKAMTGSIRRVTVTDVTAGEVELPIIVAGVEDEGTVAYVENILLKNIDVTYREAKHPRRVNKITHKDVKEAADAYPETWMMGDAPAHGIYFRHAKQVSAENCTFLPRSGDTRPKLSFYNVE